MKEFSYTIKDPLGIHARPAGLLVKKLQEFSSNATILRGEDKCDGKKLLALMKMRVKEGQTLTVQFEGGDEEAAANAMQNYMAEIL
ncbi:MAG: HPr family phosphocarrier protein [Treponema sp.]|nr:HPr family phosphocarrier protein [Treponema sp.]